MSHAQKAANLASLPTQGQESKDLGGSLIVPCKWILHEDLDVRRQDLDLDLDLTQEEQLSSFKRFWFVEEEEILVHKNLLF